MIERAGERILTGIGAADGLVVGRIALDRAARSAPRSAGDPESEEAALRAALAAAAGAIEDLMAAQDDLAAEILEFQLALIEDEDMLAPVLTAIENGTPADQAWASVLDGEVADYRAGDDEHFRARADDLLDLKDRVLRALLDDRAGPRPTAGEAGVGDIVVADDLTPSRFLELDWTRHRGAAISGGSPTSHVAILARARGIPLVVGLRQDLRTLNDGQEAVLDAESGQLILAPSAETLIDVEARIGTRASDAAAAQVLVAQPARTAAGDPVAIMVNVDDPALLRPGQPGAIAVETCDGIGLARTEFLFEGGMLPDEEKQLAVYGDLIAWAEGRPVTIRTLDAGGDKPIAGVTPEGEGNPFLGLRGLRLSLAQPALFVSSCVPWRGPRLSVRSR